MNSITFSKTVFISYRRESSEFIARSIYENLSRHQYQPVMDVENLNSGLFGNALLRHIEQSCHFVIILTPGTLERCLQPDDWLRREIEYAIDLKRNIVPIRVYGFEFGDNEQYLSGKLQQLSQMNAPTLSHEHFNVIMETVRERYLDQAGCKSLKKNSDPVEDKKSLFSIATIMVPSLNQLKAEQLLNQAFAKIQKGDYDAAIANCNEAIRLNPSSVYAFNNRGIAYAMKGKLDNAISDYNRAIDLSPKDEVPIINRGMARCEKGDLIGALSDLNEAILLNPKNSRAYDGRGQVYFAQGDLVKSLKELEIAIDLDHQYYYSFFNRGRIYNEMNNQHAALVDYNLAIQLNPTFYKAYHNRGRTYHQLHDIEKAIADYSAAIELEPNEANSYISRGSAWQEIEDYDKALADYNKAIGIEFNNYMAYCNRGEVYFAIGRLHTALRDFETTLAIKGEYTPAVAGLAVTHNKLGHQVKARRFWQQLLELDERYKDVEWVKTELNWAEPLVVEAQKLINSL